MYLPVSSFAQHTCQPSICFNQGSGATSLCLLFSKTVCDTKQATSQYVPWWEGDSILFNKVWFTSDQNYPEKILCLLNMCRYIFVLCVCVVYVYMHGYMHMHAYRIYVCGGRRSALDVLFHCSPLYFLRQVLSLNMELTDQIDWPTLPSPIFLPSYPLARLQMHVCPNLA